jgi:hypothetical protein
MQEIRNVREQVMYLETCGGRLERASQQQKEAALGWSDSAVRGEPHINVGLKKFRFNTPWLTVETLLVLMPSK